MGLRLEAVRVPIRLDRFAAETVRFSRAGDGAAYGEGMPVYEIDADGVIANQWVFEWLSPQQSRGPEPLSGPSHPLMTLPHPRSG